MYALESRGKWMLTFYLRARNPVTHLLSCLQLPNYKGFKGTIEHLNDNSYMNSGEVAIIDSTTIEISELPDKTWTQVSLPLAPCYILYKCTCFDCFNLYYLSHSAAILVPSSTF